MTTTNATFSDPAAWVFSFLRTATQALEAAEFDMAAARASLKEAAAHAEAGDMERAHVAAFRACRAAESLRDGAKEAADKAEEAACEAEAIRDRDAYTVECRATHEAAARAAEDARGAARRIMAAHGITAEEADGRVGLARLEGIEAAAWATLKAAEAE